MLLFPPPVKIRENEGFEKNDLFGRKPFGESLARLVTNANDPLVVGLDAPWGEGKTTFIKQWQGLLKSEEFGVDSIYFDSFKNDLDDSWMVLADELYNYLSLKISEAVDEKKAQKPFWQEKKESFIVGAAGMIPEPAKEGFTIDEYFKARRDMKEGRENFNSTLEVIGRGVRKQTGKPLVFIIDELDRCRPDFALDLLERIKHVFSVPGIVFVLVYNGEQMREHIRCRYGNDVRADVYLNKFISLSAVLPKNITIENPYSHNDDNCKYIEHLAGVMGMQFEASDILAEYAMKKHLAFRELEKIMTLLAVAKTSLPDKLKNWDVVQVGVSLAYQLNPALFAKLQSKTQSWEEVVEFFAFKNQSAPVSDTEDWFYYTWNSLLNPNAAQEDKKRFSQGGMWRVDPVVACCKALVNFLPANQ